MSFNHCQTCYGQKIVRPLGFIEKDCPNCVLPLKKQKQFERELLTKPLSMVNISTPVLESQSINQIKTKMGVAKLNKN